MVRFEAELQEGLQRLEELKAAVIVPTIPVNVVPSTLPSDHAAEVNLLRTTVEELTQEREQLAAAEPSQTVLAVVPTEPRGPSEVMATLIEEADTDLRRQSRFTPC